MAITTIPQPNVLPPADLDAPDAVRQAAEVARDAGAERDQAKAELHAAEAAVAQAEAADKAADQEATAAGKPLPKIRATDKARSAVDAARRKAEATDTNYRSRVNELTATIIDAREEWEGELRVQLAAAEAEATEGLATFRAAYDRHADLQRALRFIADFRPGFHDPWSGASFNTSTPRREARRERKRENTLRSISNSRRINLDESDVDRVLIELELLACDHRPWERAA